MTDTPNIDELLRKARLLVRLLEEPSQGTLTWHLAVHRVIDSIAEFHKPDPAGVES